MAASLKLMKFGVHETIATVTFVNRTTRELSPGGVRFVLQRKKSFFDRSFDPEEHQSKVSGSTLWPVEPGAPAVVLALVPPNSSSVFKFAGAFEYVDASGAVHPIDGIASLNATFGGSEVTYES
jgi:hypothetical protein